MIIVNEELKNKLFRREQIFTFSNLLSFLRLLLGAVIYWFIKSRNLEVALPLIFIAIISDFLDGYMARRLNQISEVGKVLDPLADKFCIALGSIAIYQSYGLPLWVVVVIIGRDLLIILGSLLLMGKLNYVVPSAQPGKLTVSVISLLLLSYLFQISVLYVPLQILTLLFIVVSAAHYGFRFVKSVRQKLPAEGVDS